MRDRYVISQPLYHSSTSIASHGRIHGLTAFNWVGLLALLASRAKLGAYIGLSGWMPFKSQIQQYQQSKDLDRRGGH